MRRGGKITQGESKEVIDGTGSTPEFQMGKQQRVQKRRRKRRSKDVDRKE